MNKLISNESYNILKSSGHVTPRDKKNNIIYSFRVCKEYSVTSEENTEPLKVVCSQDNPTNLNLI